MDTSEQHYPAFAGIRNDLPAERFSRADLVDAVNVDLDDLGRPFTRDGSVRAYEAGLGVHSLWADDDVCLFVEGDELRMLDDGLSSAVILADGLEPGARMRYASHNGVVYACNGFQSLAIEAGEARLWGVMPPMGLSAEPTGGSLPAGRYLFTATYLCAGGRESGALPAEVIDIAGGGIRVSIPDSDDPQVIGKVLYCSSANGDALYDAGMIPQGVQTIEFSDSSLRLQRPISTLHYGPAPVGTEVAVYRGRTYVAVGNVVYYSAPFGLELFRGDEYFQFDGAVTMIAPAEDGLFVATETQTLWFSGAAPEDMSVVQRHARGAVRGTLTHFDIGKLRDMTGEFLTPAWLSTEGICAGLPGGQLLNLTERWRFTPPAAGASLFRRRDSGHHLITTFNGA